MPLAFLWVAILIAGLDWIAVAWRNKRIEYFAKPGVMLVLLVWLWSLHGFHGQLAWFSLGAIFCLVGDVFLMLPREQFIPALVAFLAGHISYLIGFNAAWPPLNLASFILLFVVVLPAFQIYRRISASLVAKELEKLLIPIQIYTVAISLMLFSALLTLVRSDWSALPALLVSCGALLFFLSDTVLAWNRFVKPVQRGGLVVMITYHLGQIGILLGSALHYFNP